MLLAVSVHCNQELLREQVPWSLLHDISAEANKVCTESV